jgi:hypothetical protein
LKKEAVKLKLQCSFSTHKMVHSFLFIQLRVILVSVFFTAGILTQAAHLPSQARGQGASHRGHGGSHKGHGHAELGKVSTKNTSGLIMHLCKFMYKLCGWCVIPAEPFGLSD